MNSRKKRVAVAVLAALLAGGALLWAAWGRGPAAARALPEADAIFYVNLEALRRLGLAKLLPQVAHEAEYSQFIEATGFDFERDLKEAAVAVHLPAGGEAQGEPRFSEVFIARFDAGKARKYFREKAKAVESYGGKEIFVIPVEDRRVRAAIVGKDAVAVSNVEDANAIHGMIDRWRHSWLPGQGPTLLRQHYRDVPSASLLWAMAGNPFNLWLEQRMGLQIPSTEWVGSVRYNGALKLRAEAFAATNALAEQLSEELGTLLALFRSIQLNVGAAGADADVKAFFQSLEVSRKDRRTALTATASEGFVKKMISTQATAPGTGEAMKPRKR